MSQTTVTFDIPDWIVEGLSTGKYKRFGGVVRESETKTLVKFLRETSSSVNQIPSFLSQTGSVASILSLGVTIIGFAIIMNRLNKIEDRLRQVEKSVNEINRKIDLGFLAEFYTALKTAEYAFSMNVKDNRIAFARDAIQGFLKTQQVFYNYAQYAIQNNLFVADEYISILFLSYVAESRCHLELGEMECSLKALREGVERLSATVEAYTKGVEDALSVNTVDGIKVAGGAVVAAALCPFPLNLAAPIVGLGLANLLQESIRDQSDLNLLLSEKFNSLNESWGRFQGYVLETGEMHRLGLDIDAWQALIPYSEDLILEDAIVCFSPQDFVQCQGKISGKFYR